MFGTIVNGAVSEGKSRQYSIIKLKLCRQPGERQKVLVILGCDIVTADVDDILGNPEDINVLAPPAAPLSNARSPPKLE